MIKFSKYRGKEQKRKILQLETKHKFLENNWKIMPIKPLLH